MEEVQYVHEKKGLYVLKNDVAPKNRTTILQEYSCWSTCVLLLIEAYGHNHGLFFRRTPFTHVSNGIFSSFGNKEWMKDGTAL